ncbi:MAG: VOC family protein [Rhodovibrionaceae bacterium]
MTGITGIDHALIGVEDLEQARAAWRRLGFTLSPRGRHIGWGTANYCIMFASDYIELLGILDASQFTNNLDRFLEKGEGLLGAAFSCDDAAATVEALRAQGIAAEDPKDLKRILESDAGEELPRFQLVHLPREATPGVATFVVSHLTPEIVWRPEWLQHANGAKGIESFSFAVDDPLSLLPAYARLFGEDAVAGENLRLTVKTGAARLVFTTPEEAAEIAPLPGRGVPCGVAMAVRVADLRRTRKALEDNSVDFEEEEDGLRIAPEQANGLALRFLT